MKKNSIFEGIVARIEPELKAEVSLNVRIANRISDILKEKKMTQREFAAKMHKRESEISRWLTGSHGFTTSTLAKIEAVLGEPIVQVTKKQPGIAPVGFVFRPYYKECYFSTIPKVSTQVNVRAYIPLQAINNYEQ